MKGMEPKQYKDLTEQSCLALRKINNINKIKLPLKIKLSVCDWVWLFYKCPWWLFCENRVQMISYIACSWHIPYNYFTVNFSCFSLLMHISNIQLLCWKGQFEFFWGKKKKHSPSPGLADCIPLVSFYIFCSCSSCCRA